jgi:hypothetical protein
MVSTTSNNPSGQDVLVSPLGDAVSAEGVSEASQNGTAKSPKIGRPTKKDIVSKTKGHLAKRGRPPGEASAMASFKARLINSPKSRKVIDSIINAALDDNHKNQSAAWKILADRILPLSQFEKGVSSKSAITINISGLGEANIIASDNEDDQSVIDGEYSDVEIEDYEQE